MSLMYVRRTYDNVSDSQTHKSYIVISWSLNDLLVGKSGEKNINADCLSRIPKNSIKQDITFQEKQCVCRRQVTK